MAKMILSNVKENLQNGGEQKDMGCGHKLEQEPDWSRTRATSKYQQLTLRQAEEWTDCRK